MHTHPLGEYMVHIRSGNWTRVAELMLSSVHKLAAIGAELAICPDNTIHQAYGLVNASSPVPWLHIAEVVGHEAHCRGYEALGIMGTKYLMEGPVYAQVLKELGIKYRIPEKPDRERIDTIIFEELVNGTFREESRLCFNNVIRALKEQGCDAVVLGCTEIPLLVDAAGCPLPTLDSTRLLARAALKSALE